MSEAAVRVLIVDDHAIVRQGLRALLEAEEDITVTGEAGSVEEAIRRVGLDEPDLVLMDLQLPDGTGVDACREILSRWPDTTVLILTSFADDQALYSAIMAGAAGYVLKRIQPDELLQGIRAAAGGASLLDPALVEMVFKRVRGELTGDSLLDRLSGQELKIVDLIEQGLTNRQIAADLNLAEKTVKNYVSNLLTKMGMSRRSEVAAYAARRAASSRARFPATTWEDEDEG
ncbi:MAG: response regulator transcription factor [bacterium]|nr:response regulator transcription factor [bacterium]